MIAKKDYFLDADGKPTTDAKKGVSRLASKDAEISPTVAKQYGFTDGEIAEKKAEAEKSNKSAKSSENKGA